VAHHVAPGELYDGDTLRVLQDALGLHEARSGAPRQVDLRDVARDDRARTLAEARQEHLHLFEGRVLRLVENGKRVRQRPPAHERQGRHLDHLAVYKLSLIHI